MKVQNLAISGMTIGIGAGILQIAAIQILTWIGLGLTGWVYWTNLLILFLAILFAHRHLSLKSNQWLKVKWAFLVNVIVVLIAGLAQQIYMAIYVHIINPEWIEGVLTIRRDLMEANAVSIEEVEKRLIAVRNSFRPARMLTVGVVLPALYNYLFTTPTVFLSKKLYKTSS